MKERNKEGYHDPTAERAIKRVDRQNRGKSKIGPMTSILCYTLGELECFRQILEYFRR